MSILEKLSIRSPIKRKDCANATSSNSSGAISNDPCSPISEMANTESPQFEPGRLVLVDDFCSGPSTSASAVLRRDCSHEGDLGKPDSPVVMVQRRKSRLSKDLWDVLRDPSALAYFIQFLRSRGVDSLIKFWLDAESFRVSVEAMLGRRSGDEEDRANLSGDSGLPDDSAARCPVVSRGLQERATQDAVELFQKYLSKDATHSIGLTESIRNSVINGICPADGELDPQCFLLARYFVIDIFEKRYFPEFLSSVYYVKHQVDVLTSGPVHLSDIIYNDTALSCFIEYLDRLQGYRMQFYLAAEHFTQDLQRQKAQFNPMKAQLDAMTLYDSYFSMQADKNLDLGEEVRRDVEVKICGEKGLELGCFERASRLVYSILEQECLPGFLRSPSFANYIRGLVYTIQNTPELPDPSGARLRSSTTTGSDLSSNISSEQFLEPRRRTSPSTRAPDPSALWKRNQPSGLTFGKINHLGEYVRDGGEGDIGEAEDIATNRFNFKKAWKKLHKKNAKEQEAVASQIAQLIVRDVQQMASSQDFVAGDDDAIWTDT